VNLGALTKELAKQVVGGQVDKVVDSLKSSDTSKAGETPKAVTPPEAGVGAIILGQLQAMQNVLKDDQELVVQCATGLETLRVLEIFVPGWKVAILTGHDANKTTTRFICPLEALQLTCKPTPVAAGEKPVRIRFIAPKS